MKLWLDGIPPWRLGRRKRGLLLLSDLKKKRLRKRKNYFSFLLLALLFLSFSCISREENEQKLKIFSKADHLPLGFHSCGYYKKENIRKASFEFSQQQKDVGKKIK